MALEEAHDVTARVAAVEGLSGPILVMAVEDEVTGTGSLIHRLIFGVMEKEEKIEILRDWELLQITNTFSVKSYAGVVPPAVGAEAVIERLKQVFDADLAAHVPTLRRPVSWSEMLFIPITGEPIGLSAMDVVVGSATCACAAIIDVSSLSELVDATTP